MSGTFLFGQGVGLPLPSHWIVTYNTRVTASHFVKACAHATTLWPAYVWLPWTNEMDLASLLVQSCSHLSLGVAGWHFLCFTHVTLTLTQWHSYTSLTCAPEDVCAYQKWTWNDWSRFLKVRAFQTDRCDQTYHQSHLMGGNNKRQAMRIWPMTATRTDCSTNSEYKDSLVWFHSLHGECSILRCWDYTLMHLHAKHSSWHYYSTMNLLLLLQCAVLCVSDFVRGAVGYVWGIQ